MFRVFLEVSIFVRPSVRPSWQWMGYVLCRELVLGVWGLEPETNLKWMNIYWSCAPPIFWTSVSTVGLSEIGLNLGYLTCSLMAMCYVLCRELVLGVWGLEPETNLKWMNIYWSCAPPIFWTSVSTVGLSERGLNLGYLTCSLMAMCYVLCRELVLGVWGFEPETNLKWMNIYWSCAPPIFWTSVSTVGLSERGLNLGYLACSLMAMCYVLCRELVLGVWSLEPETNLKWMNIYWSCAPPIFWTSISTVGLSERGMNLGYLTCSLMAMCYVLCRELVLGFWGLEPVTNLKWMNIYWSCAPPIFWTSVSTVGLSERGLNLGYLTCSLMAMCYVLCRKLVLGFWGSEPETNLKWINI